MTINPNDLTIAREWAEDTLPVARSDRERATARVIQALPDRVIDAEDVSALHDDMRTMMGDMGEPDNDYDKGYYAAVRDWANDIYLLLPTPPRKPAMIKRGAIAVHPEHGEVLVISNHPEDSGRVWVALDSEDSIDGSWTLRVQADELTAPDEDAGGTDQTKGDNPADAPCNEVEPEEPVYDDGGPLPATNAFFLAKVYRDRHGHTWRYTHDTQLWADDDPEGYGTTISLAKMNALVGPFTELKDEEDQEPEVARFTTNQAQTLQEMGYIPQRFTTGETPGDPWLVEYENKPHYAFRIDSDSDDGERWIVLLENGLFATVVVLGDQDPTVHKITPLIPEERR